MTSTFDSITLYEHSISVESKTVTYSRKACAILAKRAREARECAKSIPSEQRDKFKDHLEAMEIKLTEILGFVKNSNNANAFFRYFTPYSAFYQVQSLEDSLSQIITSILQARIGLSGGGATADPSSGSSIRIAVQEDEQVISPEIDKAPHFTALRTMMTSRTRDFHLNQNAGPRKTVINLIKTFWHINNYALMHALPGLLYRYASIPDQNPVVRGDKMNGIPIKEIALAQLYLGHYHRLVDRTHEQAIHYYTQADSLGNIEAALYLAPYYFQGCSKLEQNGQLTYYLYQNIDTGNALLSKHATAKDRARMSALTEFGLEAEMVLY